MELHNEIEWKKARRGSLYENIFGEAYGYIKVSSNTYLLLGDSRSTFHFLFSIGSTWYIKQ